MAFPTPRRPHSPRHLWLPVGTIPGPVTLLIGTVSRLKFTSNCKLKFVGVTEAVAKMPGDGRGFNQLHVCTSVEIFFRSLTIRPLTKGASRTVHERLMFRAAVIIAPSVYRRMTCQRGRDDLREGCRARTLHARTTHQKGWSEWQDLNLRPPRPERGALPGCATLRLAEAAVL